MREHIGLNMSSAEGAGMLLEMWLKTCFLMQPCKYHKWELICPHHYLFLSDGVKHEAATITSTKWALLKCLTKLLHICVTINQWWKNCPHIPSKIRRGGDFEHHCLPKKQYIPPGMEPELGRAPMYDYFSQGDGLFSDKQNRNGASGPASHCQENIFLPLCLYLWQLAGLTPASASRPWA